MNMFENEKIFILGMARSGYAAAKLLKKHHNEILITDAKPQDSECVKELTELGITFIQTEQPEKLLDNSFDYVIKNPGIRNDHKYVLKANELNIPVINEVEFAYHLLPKVKLIAITGTNGKTTTTTLTYNILKNYYGERVKLAGNIGYPLTSILDSLKENDILVMEISCQQLANTYKHQKIKEV